MRLLEHPNAEKLQQDYLRLTQQLRERYSHDPRLDDIENDFYDFYRYVPDDKHFDGIIPKVIKGQYVNINGLLIPISDIIEQRRKNLLNEATINKAASDPFDYVVQRVVVDCGMGFSIRDIIMQMKARGIVRFLGARASCGAIDVISRYVLKEDRDDLAGTELTALDFKNSVGDVLSVLYLGPFSTDSFLVNYLAEQIATEHDVRMTVEEHV